jgi:hypothetical protein
MDDPLSNLHDRPPRYLLESDSSDEEGQGMYPGAGPSKSKSQPKIALPKQDARLTWTQGTPAQIHSVILGVGQAGRYLLRRTGLEPKSRTAAAGADRSADAEVKLGDRRIGQGYVADGTLVLSVAEGLDSQDVLYGLARNLIEGLPAASWLV